MLHSAESKFANFKANFLHELDTEFENFFLGVNQGF
jgi:hypothetical protein